jgi:hypothetical protein
MEDSSDRGIEPGEEDMSRRREKKPAAGIAAGEESVEGRKGCGWTPRRMPRSSCRDGCGDAGRFEAYREACGDDLEAQAGENLF